jgi:signal peptidase I
VAHQGDVAKNAAMRWIRWVGVAMIGILAWCTVWPAQLGGGADYVTTFGNSMEPSIHAGDLIITRAADSYGPGDAVAYLSDDLRTVVLHRIVSVQNGRFTLQGDNNSWLDPGTPTQERFVGKMWMLVPQGGVWLQRLTSLPVLVGIAVLLVLLGGIAKEDRTRRGRRRRRTWAKAPQVPIG